MKLIYSAFAITAINFISLTLNCCFEIICLQSQECRKRIESLSAAHERVENLVYTDSSQLEIVQKNHEIHDNFTFARRFKHHLVFKSWKRALYHPHTMFG